MQLRSLKHRELAMDEKEKPFEQKPPVKKRNHVIPHYLLKYFAETDVIKKHNGDEEEKSFVHRYDKSGNCVGWAWTDDVTEKRYNVGHSSKYNRNEIEDWLCSIEGVHAGLLRDNVFLSESQMRDMVKLQFARGRSSKKAIMDGASKRFGQSSIDWSISIRDIYENQEGEFSTWSFGILNFKDENLLISDNAACLFAVPAENGLYYGFVFLPISPRKTIIGIEEKGTQFLRRLPLTTSILNAMSIYSSFKMSYGNNSNIAFRTADEKEVNPFSSSFVPEEDTFVFSLLKMESVMTKTRVIEKHPDIKFFTYLGKLYVKLPDSIYVPLSLLSEEHYSVDMRVSPNGDFDIPLP